MKGLSAAGLADLAGVTRAEVGRLVRLGVLVARDGPGPFLETAVYRRWAVRSARTYRQVSQETGVPLELLASFLEAIGFARTTPDEPMREDELEIVPLLQLGHARGYQQGLRLIAQVEKELWQARFVAPLLEAGADQQTARERAAERVADLNAA